MIEEISLSKMVPKDDKGGQDEVIKPRVEVSVEGGEEAIDD